MQFKVAHRASWSSFLLAMLVVCASCECTKCNDAGEQTDAERTATGDDAQALIKDNGDRQVTNKPETPSHDAAGRSARARPTKPRIPPVKKEDWSPKQQELLAPFERTGRLFNVFTTMANHPDLAEDWLTFATHILGSNSLPPRDREILILRIGWLCKAEYEWAQHVRIGKGTGLSEDDVRRIAEGPDAAGLSDHDRLLLQATGELRDDACLSDETWSQLAKDYSTQQMMDLVFTVGQYNLVSMALNSFGVQLDEGLTGFPQ
ncbi:MAG TPA: carboxymuconolactone decarboxylase family protein [Pirellulales bacterium]|jgi:alkylhydroperoxidase family enzyme